MGSKELGLRLAAVASLAIPPTGAIGVQNSTAGALDGDVVAFDLEERAGPFLVAPSRGALEDDLHISIQVSDISWRFISLFRCLRSCHRSNH
jgi:hypothetical protein